MDKRIILHRQRENPAAAFGTEWESLLDSVLQRGRTSMKNLRRLILFFLGMSKAIKLS